MRIFLDIGHPAHVHYFRNFIQLMHKKGHEFLISARDKEVSQILLRNYNIPYFDRGKGSNNLIGKLGYLFKANALIFRKAKIFNPDLFISFASPYAAQVATLMHKPHISFTDTENAKLGILSFAPLTECIITPDTFKGSFGSKHILFRGFMELSYLHPNYYKPDKNIFNILGLNGLESFAVLRFISWGANHDIGQSGIPDNKKIELTLRLAKDMRVFISSEGNLPEKLNKYKIQISPEKMHDVLASASIYIGEGATMASECAILGTPSIYVNSLTAGTIESQQNYGLLFGYRNFDGVFSRVEELLCNPNLGLEFAEKRDRMLNEQIDVSAFIVWFIENYPESFEIIKQNPDYQDRFR